MVASGAAGDEVSTVDFFPHLPSERMKAPGSASGGTTSRPRKRSERVSSMRLRIASACARSRTFSNRLNR
jgi:hypothetical protein